MNPALPIQVLLGKDCAGKVGIGLRAVQLVFQQAISGRPLRGKALAVVQIPGHRGGAFSTIQGLRRDGCSPGEPVRVRRIAWMDASSRFVWVTPVFLSKGQGVRQENVAESLAQVIVCPPGGISAEITWTGVRNIRRRRVPWRA